MDKKGHIYAVAGALVMTTLLLAWTASLFFTGAQPWA
jgi:hypothetical protein